MAEIVTSTTTGIRRDPFYITAGRKIARQLTDIPSVRHGLRVVARAGGLPPSVWQRLPVEETFRVNCPEGVSFQYHATAGDLIGRALYWRGVDAWESATIRTFRRLVRHANSFMDIGANSGVYTVLAAAERPDIRCDSFEPVPHIYERLCEHIRLNHCEDRCKAHNVALSDFVGTAKFHVPFVDFPSSSSLNPTGFRGIHGRLIDVPVKTVDDVVAERKIDLIKIDVEGFEDRVLQGMGSLLERSRPVMIVECVPDGPYRKVAEMLSPLNYQFFHIREEAVLPQQTIVPDFRDVNYLCIPQERSKWLV